MEFQNIEGGGTTSPQGFSAGAAQASLKKPGRYDLAVLISDIPAKAAAVFTTNKFQAAPVLVSRKHLIQEKCKGIVVNSGFANACTGVPGLSDAEKMTEITAKYLGCAQEEILVASTGVIGVFLPMDRIETGISDACANLSPENGHRAALAIMTTDTFVKEAALQYQYMGEVITIGGMVKGSGMIHPDMATLLGFITTDAVIDRKCLKKALDRAVQESFNMVTVDRDTSTNDSLFLLANGAAGNVLIEDSDSEGFAIFQEALRFLLIKLTKMIARDGEGATKMLEVQVSGAKDINDARLGARSIAASNLVKAAIFGEDANWGRIVCALGYSKADFDPALVDVFIGELAVAHNGEGLKFDEDQAKEILKKDTIIVRVALNQGEASATAWGCDLTYDYVKINGDYRT